MDKIVLSIVFVNYKTKELSLKLLQSIYDHKSGYYDPSCEVIVVDNGSNDGIGKVIKNRFPKVNFLQNSSNVGFSKGYNRAINESRGQYVLVINSDTEILEGTLSECVTLAKRYNNEVVLAGKLILPDGSVQNSCYKLPTIMGAIKEYFFSKSGSYSMYAPVSESEVKIEGAVGACLLIPRNVIDKVGLFDEGMFLYFEDIEYCRRLGISKIPIYYCPTIRLIHYHGMSSKQIGGHQSYEFLKKGSLHYNGRLKYIILWVVLWLGQKFRPVSIPKSIR